MTKRTIYTALVALFVGGSAAVPLQAQTVGSSFGLGGWNALFLGLVGQRVTVRVTNNNWSDMRILGSIHGDEQFIQLGAAGSLVLDPLVDSETTGTRIRISLRGRSFPDFFDVERAFGKAGAEVSALLAPSPDPWISLALRGGGEQVWGRFPWYEAAFVGGTSTIRGWDEQRFAGDASAFGSAELRLRMWRPRVVVPVGIGVFGFADAGRVYLNGASPGGWHTSLGGGIWFQPVRQPKIVRAGVGVSDEAIRLFVILGLPY